MMIRNQLLIVHLKTSSRVRPFYLLGLLIFLPQDVEVSMLYYYDISEILTPVAFAVILEHFDQVVGDCFMDCVNCLIRFANNKSSPRISLKAIALLRICEDRLAEVCLFCL